jgi:hypothetical protein
MRFKKIYIRIKTRFMINILKYRMRRFLKVFEIVLLDRIVDDKKNISDYNLYKDLCNKYGFKESDLIEYLYNKKATW